MSLNEDENEQIKEDEEQQINQPKMPSLINKRKQNTILIKKAHKVSNDEGHDQDETNEVEVDDQNNHIDNQQLKKKRSNGNYHSDSDDHLETDELGDDDDDDEHEEIFDEQPRDVEEEFYPNEQIEEEDVNESQLYNNNTNNNSYMQDDTEDAADQVYEQAHVEEANSEFKEEEQEEEVFNEHEEDDDDENDQDFTLGQKKSAKKPKRRQTSPSHSTNYDNVSMLIKTVTSLAKKHQQVSQQKSRQNAPNGTMTPTYNKTVSSESKLTSNLPSAHANMSAQANGNSKKQMRFQCRFCAYKSHSVSLMQNHIYRHIDTTPYSCFYCGHKSTTKSTIMVHIELCHPNMEVKIKESRVREEDYYLDLNSSSASSSSTANQISSLGNELNKFAKSVSKGFKSNHATNTEDKFEIIPNKCSTKRKHEDESNNKPSNQLNMSSNPSSTVSSPSTYSSPSISPVQTSTLTTVANKTASNHKTGKEEHNENFIQLQNPNAVQMEGDEEQMGDANSNGNYVTVFNRPKQYFGSLYEPDKQYSCKLCTYTTNHKPSMEDHVYVHTNKRPYRCGYCNEEIYTRYAATYHNKYKHPGEPRNFIKDEQDVSIYYVNRAKKSSTETSGPSPLGADTNKPESSELDEREEGEEEEEEEKTSRQSDKKSKHSSSLSSERNGATKKTKRGQEETHKTGFENHPLMSHQNAAVNNSNANISAATAAAIQLMLSNAAANLLPTPITQNPSPASSSSSSSTSSSSSSNTSNNSPSFMNKNEKQQPYDFNLALKMYQIQFQSLMAANYLQQSMRSSSVIQPPSLANDAMAAQNHLLASYLNMAALPNMKMNENLPQSDSSQSVSHEEEENELDENESKYVQAKGKHSSLKSNSNSFTSPSHNKLALLANQAKFSVFKPSVTSNSVNKASTFHSNDNHHSNKNNISSKVVKK